MVECIECNYEYDPYEWDCCPRCNGKHDMDSFILQQDMEQWCTMDLIHEYDYKE